MSDESHVGNDIMCCGILKTKDSNNICAQLTTLTL